MSGIIIERIEAYDSGVSKGLTFRKHFIREEETMNKIFIWRELFSYLGVIIFAGGLALFLNKVVVVNAQIPSESM